MGRCLGISRKAEERDSETQTPGRCLSGLSLSEGLVVQMAQICCMSARDGQPLHYGECRDGK